MDSSDFPLGFFFSFLGGLLRKTSSRFRKAYLWSVESGEAGEFTYCDCVCEVTVERKVDSTVVDITVLGSDVFNYVNLSEVTVVVQQFFDFRDGDGVVVAVTDVGNTWGS